MRDVFVLRYVEAALQIEDRAGDGRKARAVAARPAFDRYPWCAAGDPPEAGVSIASRFRTPPAAGAVAVVRAAAKSSSPERADERSAPQTGMCINLSSG